MISRFAVRLKAGTVMTAEMTLCACSRDLLGSCV